MDQLNKYLESKCWVLGKRWDYQKKNWFYTFEYFSPHDSTDILVDPPFLKAKTKQVLLEKIKKLK